MLKLSFEISGEVLTLSLNKTEVAGRYRCDIPRGRLPLPPVDLSSTSTPEFAAQWQS